MVNFIFNSNQEIVFIKTINYLQTDYFPLIGVLIEERLYSDSDLGFLLFVYVNMLGSKTKNAQ
jgi:hypothetical protein